jgi:subtilase family serine protease
VLNSMRKILVAISIVLIVLATTSTLAYSAPVKYNHVTHPLHTSVPVSVPQIVGGIPFCKSGSLGTVICYPPSFFKTAYNFPAGLDGTGSKIVIVDAYGSPTIQSDLDLFDTTFGLPAATVNRLCPPTFTGSASDVCPDTITTFSFSDVCGSEGWAEETTLDVTMSHGLAPGAKIYLVEASSCFDTDINAAELAVVSQPSLRGGIMSQSFGEPDDMIDPAIKAQADVIANIGRINVWTVLASSGDDGANEAYSFTGTTELTPSWPSTNPITLGVGGTQGLPYGGQYGPPPGPGGTFTCAAGATCNTGLVTISGGVDGCTTTLRPGVPTGCSPVGYGGEGTWNEFSSLGPRSSGGGGISQLYTRPDYQLSLPNTFTTLLGSSASATGKRLNPDVSFNAAVAGGIVVPFGLLCSSSSSPPCPAWLVFGGTSASSPAWAAIIALVNQANGGPVGFINPPIYSLAQSALYSHSFHDVIKGNNSDFAGSGVDGFKAGTGYDLATGWGTPNVANFISDILSANPFWQMTVNLRLANYKTVNVLIQVLKGATVVSSKTITLSPGGTTATTTFTSLKPATYTVKVSGYSVQPQSQTVPVPPTAIVNFVIK